MSADRARFRRTSTYLFLAVGLIAAPTARAQTDARDSLPVHAGSYALEGGVGVNSSTFGALRFFSPRSALGATLTAGYSHESGDKSTFSAGGTSLNLGYRRYGALRDRVAGFGTVGLTGGYSHQRQTQQQATQSYTYSTTSGNIGAFGELGATYLVARRLTVNASAQASVVGLFSRVTNGATSGGFQESSVHQSGYNANLGPVRIGVTLFL